MKKWFLLFLTAVLTPVWAEQLPEKLFQETPSVKGKVNVTDFLNVRLGPGLRHPVTGRLKPDQEVEILRIAENWLEIKAPETLKIYVSEARVDVEGKLSGELNMRSRMDSTAPSYGILSAGSVVKRLPERRNGWVRIVPPANLKVYVAAICVNFDRKQFDEKGLPLSAKENKPVQKSLPEAKPAETPAVPAVPAAPAEVKNKAEEIKTAPAEVKNKAEEVKTAPAEVKNKAEEVKTAPANIKTEILSGVVVKWKFAKTPETALAFLDAPNGKNQAFITGKTPELQAQLAGTADSGKTITVNGNYIIGKVPPVFEVSAINEKNIK